MLPSGELQRERAAVLQRLGRHTEALNLLTLELGDWTAAETYCDEVHAASSSSSAQESQGPSNVYNAFLGAALAPPGGHGCVFLTVESVLCPNI